MITTAVAIQKGGVGKTTLAANLALGLVARGARVLAVDADPQGNLTHWLAKRNRAEVPDLRDYYPEGEELRPPAEVGERLHLIGATRRLAEVERLTNPDVWFALQEGLRGMAARHDYAVLDTPPSLGVLTVSALAAADKLVVPLEADVLSYLGANQLLDLVGKVRSRFNPRLEIAGYVLNRVDGRTSLSREVREDLSRSLGDRLFPGVLPLSSRMRELPGSGEGIWSRDPDGAAAREMTAFLDEFIRRTGGLLAGGESAAAA